MRLDEFCAYVREQRSVHPELDQGAWQGMMSMTESIPRAMMRHAYPLIVVHAKTPEECVDLAVAVERMLIVAGYHDQDRESWGP